VNLGQVKAAPIAVARADIALLLHPHLAHRQAQRGRQRGTHAVCALAGVDHVQPLVLPPRHAVGDLQRNLLFDGLDCHVLDLDFRRVVCLGVAALERLRDADDGAVEVVIPLLGSTGLHRLEEVHRGGQDLVLDLDEAHGLVADVLRVRQHDGDRRTDHEHFLGEEEAIGRP